MKNNKMKKNKKGFTLIELLAVIVILAIIALIAVPLILNIIERVRKGAFARSAENVLKASNLYYTNNLLDVSGPEAISFTCDGKKCLSSKLDEKGNQINLNVDGSMGKGIVNIGPKGEVDFELSNGVYCALKTAISKGITISKGNCDEKDDKKAITINPAPSDTNGLLGIVYYNPTIGVECNEYDYDINLQNHINEENTTATGLKNGCMKWYVYNDNGSTYDMILDHNTTANVAWNSSNSNKEMVEVKSALENDTEEWQSELNARLITVNEIAMITGNTSLNSSTPSSGNIFLDSNSNIQVAFSEGASKYAWLYDYTKDCTRFGCNIDDSAVISYWTSTPVFDSTINVWRISQNGALNCNWANSYNKEGIRPVITINKYKDI